MANRAADRSIQPGTGTACTFRVLASACTVMFLGQGCIGSGVGPLKPVRPVCGTCEGQDRYVRLEVPGADSAGDRPASFAHPVTLSQPDWTAILGSLRIKRESKGLLFAVGKNPVEPVFTGDEIAFLSRALGQAFVLAKPEEWVVFAVMRPQTPEVREITSGAWFAEGRTLHLRLANYRLAVTMEKDRELVWEYPTRMTVRNDFELMPGDFQTVLKEPEKAIPFWRPTSYEVGIDYRALLLADATPPSANQKPASTGQPPVSRQTVEERLQTLGQLKERGLITDEEYRAKRTQILDQF